MESLSLITIGWLLGMITATIAAVIAFVIVFFGSAAGPGVERAKVWLQKWWVSQKDDIVSRINKSATISVDREVSEVCASVVISGFRGMGEKLDKIHEDTYFIKNFHNGMIRIDGSEHRYALH
jgi:hypothetical protein